jgi:hypothetical protein
MKITRIRLEPHDGSFWKGSWLNRKRLRNMLAIHKTKKDPNPLFDFPGRTITSQFRANVDMYVFICTIVHDGYSLPRGFGGKPLAGRTTITLSDRDDYLHDNSPENPTLKLLYALADSKGT